MQTVTYFQRFLSNMQTSSNSYPWRLSFYACFLMFFLRCTRCNINLSVCFVMFRFKVNLAVNLNKPIIPLLMEKTDWPPKGSMGPIFSEYLFIRFFQRGGEGSNVTDKRYWPIPKFQELLMQLNFYVVPDQKKVQKGTQN